MLLQRQGINLITDDTAGQFWDLHELGFPHWQIEAEAPDLPKHPTFFALVAERSRNFAEKRRNAFVPTEGILARSCKSRHIDAFFTLLMALGRLVLDPGYPALHLLHRDLRKGERRLH